MFGLSVKNARQVNPSNNGCSLVPKARPRDSLTSHGNASASLVLTACEEEDDDEEEEADSQSWDDENNE